MIRDLRNFTLHKSARVNSKAACTMQISSSSSEFYNTSKTATDKISYRELIGPTVLIGKKAQSHSCYNLIFMVQDVKRPKGKHIGHHNVCPKPTKTLAIQ
jgi:hypothetical protein